MLQGISEIRAFFRTNETPIYFVSATAFNLLGIDRWVRNFTFVNWFDSFDGTHPNVFVPKERGYHEFELVKRLKQDASWIADARGKAVKIISQLLFDLPPGEVLFISDVVAELDAARAAGMQTALAVRPGNAAVAAGHGHREVRSFGEIAVG